MAAPSFNPSSDYETGTTSGAGTFTVNVPASVDESSGEVLFAVIVSNGSDDGNNALPAAFTEEQASDPNSSTAPEIQIGYRFTASEPASYTFTSGDGGKSVGILVRITGVDTGTPINVKSSANTGTSTTPSSDDVTTTVNECLVIRVTTERQGQDVTTFAESSNQIDFHSAAGSRCGVGICTKEQTTAGSTGAGSWTLDESGVWAAFTICFAPTAGGGGDPEAMVLDGKLVRGGLLMGGALVRK